MLSSSRCLGHVKDGFCQSATQVSILLNQAKEDGSANKKAKGAHTTKDKGGASAQGVSDTAAPVYRCRVPRVAFPGAFHTFVLSIG